MPRPPGSESLAPNEAAVLTVIAAAGVNALAAVYPAAGTPAAVVSVVQGTFSLLPQKSDLDPQGLTRQIGEALRQMGLQKNTLQWAVNRASEILLRCGSEPVNRIRARVKDARLEAAWMAKQALDAARGSDLDPGEGEESQHTLQVLRIYYDVYLHHEKGLAEITADVLAQLSDKMNKLKIELRSFAIELLADSELRKAERNCYVPEGLPSPELSLRSITAKYGVVPFYDTQQFKDVYERIKQAERPVLLVITGEGGSGKTRLAIELGRRLREEGWRYCFIAANDGDDDFRPLFSRDATPIFAVADYAMRVQDRVEQFVSAAAKEGWHGKPFCLALLDRKMPAYVTKLEKPTDSDPNGVGQKILFNQVHVALKSLEEDEARVLFGSAVRELARHYELELPPDIEEKWLLLRKSAHLRPLNVTLGALLAVRGTLERPLSDEEILSEALKFEVKDRWMAQGMEEDAIPRAMDVEQGKEYELALKLLAAYVVLRGRTKVDELQQVATELISSGKFSFLVGHNAHQLATLLCKMLPDAEHADACAPLEPDPVADYLITILLNNNYLIYPVQQICNINNIDLLENMVITMWRAVPVSEGKEPESVEDFITNSLGGIGIFVRLIMRQNVIFDLESTKTLKQHVGLYIAKQLLYMLKGQESSINILQQQLLGIFKNNTSYLMMAEKSINAILNKTLHNTNYNLLDKARILRIQKNYLRDLVLIDIKIKDVWENTYNELIDVLSELNRKQEIINLYKEMNETYIKLLRRREDEEE